MRVWEAVMNNVAFMLSPFLLPSVIVQTGWIFGVVFMAFSNIVTYTTGMLLGHICTAYPNLYSYPVMAEEVFRIIGQSWCGFGVVGQERCAKGGRIFVQVMQLLSYYLAGISELIFLMQYFSQLLKNAHLGGHEMCQLDWLFVSALCCWPFMQIPDFHESRWSALGTNLLVGFAVVVAFYEIFLVTPWTCDPGPEYPEVTFGSLMVGLTGIAYAYGGHGLYPEILREMEDPSEWPSVMRWTYGIVTPLYIVLGFLGYYAYGAHARANINSNFPNNIVNRAAIFALLLGEFYYVYVSVLVVMLQVELALGVDPKSWCKKNTLMLPEKQQRVSVVANPKRASQAPVHAAPHAAETLAGAEIAEPRPWREWASGRRCSIPPAGFRLVFRSLFLGSMVLISATLLGGNGDLLLSLQSLSGAIGFVMMTYVLPLLFGWVLLPQTGKLTLVYHVASFILGLFIFVLGTIFAVKDVVEKSGAFSTEESHCHYYGYNYYSGGSHFGCRAALGKPANESSDNASAMMAFLYA